MAYLLSNWPIWMLLIGIPLFLLKGGPNADLLLFGVGWPLVIFLISVYLLFSGDIGLFVLGLMGAGISAFWLSAVLIAYRTK